MGVTKSSLKNERVLFRQEGRLGFITLNRPERMNALDVPLIQEFKAALEVVRDDPDISVVIITGAGKAFSAGADLSLLHALGTPDVFRREQKELWHRGFGIMEDMEKVFIAALNGITLGGALELALACDFRVAAAGVTMALPEIKYGLIPDAGGTNRLAKLIGPSRAKEMVLSGNAITCDEAYRIGLINRILPADKFMEETIAYAKGFLDNSPTALGLGKIAVDKSLSQDTKSGLDDAMIIQSLLLNSKEYQANIKKYQEREKK